MGYPIDTDLLHDVDSADKDYIDRFYSGLWEDGLPGGVLKIGRVLSSADLGQMPGQVKSTRTGLYVVRTNDGRTIPDCYLLSPMAFRTSTSGAGRQFKPGQLPGQYYKPYPGALCLVGTAQGGMAFILGFWNPPSTIASASDQNTNETKPGVSDDQDAGTPGDWVLRTEHGSINLKRGGSLIIECGATIRNTFNPDNGNSFSQSKSRIDVCEGYKLTRNRLKDTERETLSTEEFFDKIVQRGQTATRIRVKNGHIDSTTRYELSIAEINYATITDPIVSYRARERYFSDGSWIAEGPKYQWGGPDADEPIVLGNTLANIISDLCDIIAKIKVPTAWGPSGTPLPPTPIDLTNKIKRKLDLFKSDYMFSSKRPASLRLVND